MIQQPNGPPTTAVLMLKNDKQGGLGMPLPAGSTALYSERARGRLLLGLGAITDHTVDETVRLAAGDAHPGERRTLEAIECRTDARRFSRGNTYSDQRQSVHRDTQHTDRRGGTEDRR